MLKKSLANALDVISFPDNGLYFQVDMPMELALVKDQVAQCFRARWNQPRQRLTANPTDCLSRNQVSAG